jgi:MinD-like ATPase involved in chromosome partitioning or flagellar assembly
MIVCTKPLSSRPNKCIIFMKGGAGKSTLLAMMSNTAFIQLRKSEIEPFDIDRSNPTLGRNLTMRRISRHRLVAPIAGGPQT